MGTSQKGQVKHRYIHTFMIYHIYTLYIIYIYVLHMQMYVYVQYIVYTSTLFLGIQTAVEVQILMLSNGVAGFWSCFHMHCVDCGLELLIYYIFLQFLCRLAMSSRWPRRIVVGWHAFESKDSKGTSPVVDWEQCRYFNLWVWFFTSCAARNSCRFRRVGFRRLRI